jgi:putative redox protein
MSVEIAIEYQGQLRCKATHLPSGSTLVTDAPTDNHGRGEMFSPTDLVGTALGTCILTTMAIVADRNSIDLRGTTARVIKEMTPQGPRKIARLTVQITVPLDLSDEQKLKLERAAAACPVHKSLVADVQIPVQFTWGPKT